jgi:hypothetical protein
MIIYRHNGEEIDITLEGTDDKIDWFRYNFLIRWRRETK